jgi:hypothetical protein
MTGNASGVITLITPGFSVVISLVYLLEIVTALCFLFVLLLPLIIFDLIRNVRIKHKFKEWINDFLDQQYILYFETGKAVGYLSTLLPSFLKLFNCLKERHMLDEKNISNLLRYANYDLSDLTNRVQCLTNEIINLEGQKRNLMNKVILWNAQLSDLGRTIDIKNQQLKRMGK